MCPQKNPLRFYLTGAKQKFTILSNIVDIITYYCLMQKEQILDILVDWNFWRRELPTGIERREYLSRAKELLGTGHVLTLLGARRAGKSFLMRQIAQKLMAEGRDKNSILIINFEDPRFTDLNVQTLQQIYEVYQEELEPQNKPFIFLDEVQEVEGWEKWVNTMHELRKGKIVISGSNAKLLSRDLATLLTGRHLDLYIWPLSFKEYLKFKDCEIKKELDMLEKKIHLRRLLREYLERGAFPEVVLTEKKKEILLAYFEDILTKDLIKRYKVKKIGKLETLAKYYLTNISNPITFRSLSRFLELSTDTVEKFSNYLESSFMLFFLKRFSFKIREQEKSSRKVYAIDPGLSNAVSFSTSPNWGRLAENIIFLELRRKKAINPGLELYYWKDEQQREVDFVLKERLEIKKLIQVCWDINNLQTKEREVKNLAKAMRELKVREGLILTEDHQEEIKIKEGRIKFNPILQWLLWGSKDFPK